MFHWLIWFVLVLCTLSSSPANKTIDDLQAGTFIFQTIENTQTHLFMWQFKKAFEKTPQLTFALNKMEISSEEIPGSFDLAPEAVTSTGVILSWTRQTKKWISIQINYLASRRTDLVFGHQYAKITNGSSALSEVAINPPLKSQKSTIARMYLTGCSVGSQLFDCGVSGKDLTATTLTVAVYANHQGNSSLKEVFVSFSYILFSPSEAKFSSYGGMQDKQSFVGSWSENIHKTIYQTEYLLFGFSKLTLNPNSHQSISVDIDSDMVITYSALQAINFRFLYIVIGKSSLESCPDSSQPFEWDGACVIACPNSTYAESYSNGGKSCHSCSQKLHKQLVNGSCVCKEGFSMQRDLCIEDKQVRMNAVSAVPDKVDKGPESPANELLNLYEKMKQKLNFEINNSSNDSKVGKEKGALKEQSVGLKGQNVDVPKLNQKQKKETRKSGVDTQQRSSLQTKIIKQTEDNQSRMEMSAYPSYQNQDTEASQPNRVRCTTSPSIDESPLLLPTFIDQERTSSACSPSSSQSFSCGSNSFNLEGTCLCNPGYSRNNGQCIPIDSQFTPLPLYVQQFPLSRNKTHGGCAFDQKCVFPSFLGPNGQCVCPCGYVMYGNSCISCPYPGVFDYTQGKCLQLCQQNEVFDSLTHRCQCKPGFGFGKNKRCILCQDGSFLFNGYCVLCPDGKVYDSGCQKCVCPNGTLQDSTGKCVGRCGRYEHFDLQKGSCGCDQGFGRVNGRCALCPEGQIVDQNGVCTPCLGNQEIIEGVCQCKKGFILRNSKCISCEKIQKGFLFDLICSTCSPGYEMVEGGCRCQSANIMHDNRCLPCNQVPEAFMSQGVCIKCEPGKVAYNGNCVDPGTFALENSKEAASSGKVLSLGRPSVCGNGLVEEPEECDDRNKISGDGCSSSCKIEARYICQRMPSRCKPEVSINSSNQTAKEPRNITAQAPLLNSPQTPVSSNSSQVKSMPGPTPNVSAILDKGNLWLEGDIYGNSNQIFIVLNTKTAFDFTDQSTMQNFLKAQFSGIRPPTVFFNQRPAPSKQLFDCLCIFPSGVPNSQFSIDFSYDKDGKQGAAKVNVDPLAISAPSRSRATGRDRP